MPDFIQYEHHFRKVWVRDDLKGKHREHCLCYRCKRFTEDPVGDPCLVAEELYDLCVKYGLTTPVYECPFFKLKE